MGSSCHGPAAVPLPGQGCAGGDALRGHSPQNPLLNAAQAPHPSDQDITEQSFINVTKILAGVNNRRFMDFGL